MHPVPGSGAGADHLGPTADPAAAARAALAALDQDARGRLLATLARRFGDLDLAEDMVQEAFVQALHTWPRTGVPKVPEAWLHTTARRKALDVVRRQDVLAQKLARLHLQEERQPRSADLGDPADQVADPGQLDPSGDDRLGLFFACAHPVLRAEDRVALTLRFVAGLQTPEVAHALLVSVSTMQQRLIRAKKRIRTLGVPFEVPRPEDLVDRLAGVQRVVYLLYAEGFARSTGTAHRREDLTGEAVRLARVLHQLLPQTAEVTGLLALLLLTEARQPARTDERGRPVPLPAQDRSLWDRALIEEGTRLAERAAGATGAGTFAIQAAIAAVHAEAARYEETDWDQIAVLYRLLEGRDPSPVVRLGRAVALGRARGAAVGLLFLDQLADDPALARFRPFHTARAVTLEQLDRHEAAAAAYRRALELPGNQAEDEFLTATLAGLDHGAD